VVDIAPTVLEAASLPFPKMVNGTEQLPFDGPSMVYTFDDAKAKDRHTTQYFEMFGNRAIYHDGWVACTRHSIPWLMAQNPPLKDDVWELYNVAEDFSEANTSAVIVKERCFVLIKAFSIRPIIPGKTVSEVRLPIRSGPARRR
jgi:arylsulfatase A-like enzyme